VLKERNQGARTCSQRPHELKIIDAQRLGAAPKVFVSRVLLYLLGRQRVVLVAEVCHELLLLLSDGHSFCRTHRLRGMWQVVGMEEGLGPLAQV
jgi:hypothetical protein